MARARPVKASLYRRVLVTDRRLSTLVSFAPAKACFQLYILYESQTADSAIIP